MRQIFPLDDWTTDRLLAGMVDPDDAPPGYAGLARALVQARGPVKAGDLAGRDRVVAAVAAVVAEASPPTTVSAPLRRRSMLSRMLGTKVAAASLAAVLLAGGAAAAATGSLPGAVQDAADSVLDRVGVTLPLGDATDDNTPASSQGKAAHDARDARAAEDGADEAPDAAGDASDSDSDIPVGPVTDDPAAENGVPASDEGKNAHTVRDLRNGDGSAAADTDWKAVRDEFHAEHKAEHAADPASAAADARTSRDDHLATVEEQKAERDALKDARPADDADDSDDVADDDADDSDDVADDESDDESGKGKGHENDDEGDEAPTTTPTV